MNDLRYAKEHKSLFQSTRVPTAQLEKSLAIELEPLGILLDPVPFPLPGVSSSCGVCVTLLHFFMPSLPGGSVALQHLDINRLVFNVSYSSLLCTGFLYTV